MHILRAFWLVLFVSLAVPAWGAERVTFKVVGSSDNQAFDPRSIPAEIQPGYLALKVYCIECHAEERIITTLKTGKSPVTRQPYGEKDFRDKVVKILRGSKTELDRSSAKDLVNFFTFIINNGRIS